MFRRIEGHVSPADHRHDVILWLETCDAETGRHFPDRREIMGLDLAAQFFREAGRVA